jgi:hypothetical protein
MIYQLHVASGFELETPGSGTDILYADILYAKRLKLQFIISKRLFVRFINSGYQSNIWLVKGRLFYIFSLFLQNVDVCSKSTEKILQ